MTTPLIYKNTQQTNLLDRHLVLCFQVHQPRRLKKLTAAEPDTGAAWLDDELDRSIMERVARNCYIPTNTMLLRLIEKYPQIKIAFSISGTAIEQMEAYTPEVLESFRALAATGSVDFLAETYYHSIAFLMDSEEFEIQILEHAEKIVEHFGIRPAVFRNTSLIYNDDIGRRISMMGFQGVLTEGDLSAFKNHSPHYLYEHRDLNGLKVLLRNPNLSDDISFRVALSDWHLTAEKFMSWLEAMPETERLVTIALDYETFGEHHKPDSGVFQFLENLLLLLAIANSYKMMTPAEAVQKLKAEHAISIPDYLAISGSELSDWVGNEKQREAFAALIHIEAAIKGRANTQVTKLWRYLQASDHFYYMSDRPGQAIHLSPYSSSAEAFEQYMQVIRSIQYTIHDGQFFGENDPEKLNEAIEAERRNINAPVWALNIDSRHGHNH
jgi:alpha-amylase